VLSRETGSPEPEEPSMPRTSARPDPHLSEAGEREDPREAESWLSLALSLLSLGDEEEGVAAYERAYTIDPDRAQRSLFRPMLRLMTVAAGNPVDDEEPASEAPEGPEPPRPERRYEPPADPPFRPEVA
ncbi:MAG TPA: hypothetical protein VGV89_02945, partial [Thermoplasmata archaeon]|nr:hypothetical protein [Thermoplasmata archaeon]